MQKQKLTFEEVRKLVFKNIRKHKVKLRPRGFYGIVGENPVCFVGALLLEYEGMPSMHLSPIIFHTHATRLTGWTIASKFFIASNLTGWTIAEIKAVENAFEDWDIKVTAEKYPKHDAFGRSLRKYADRAAERESARLRKKQTQAQIVSTLRLVRDCLANWVEIADENDRREHDTIAIREATALIEQLEQKGQK